MNEETITTMLCSFCKNIDLDQLSEEQGYKHHVSCADLIQSAQHGCESCTLILDSQWIEVGGNLQVPGHDLGTLDTQIVARTVNQKPGAYERIRYGQEARRENHHQAMMGVYEYEAFDQSTTPKCPFLWSFLTIASHPGE